jgi:hypothetical protein
MSPLSLLISLWLVPTLRVGPFVGASLSPTLTRALHLTAARLRRVRVIASRDPARERATPTGRPSRPPSLGPVPSRSPPPFCSHVPMPHLPLLQLQANERGPARPPSSSRLSSRSESVVASPYAPQLPFFHSRASETPSPCRILAEASVPSASLGELHRLVHFIVDWASPHPLPSPS